MRYNKINKINFDKHKIIIRIILTVLIVLISLTALLLSSRKFQIYQAGGSLNHLSPILQRAFKPDDFFNPIPKPKSNDWLAVHKEYGQTFKDFLDSKWKKPDEIRDKIYIQPLEHLPRNCGISLEILRKFVQIYFQLEVKILSPDNAKNQIFTTRINQYSQNCCKHHPAG